MVGLGNLLLQDDGVGVHAVRALRKVLPLRILAVEVGTAVLDGLHLFEWADRIVAIDAMQAGGAPGTIYSFGVDEVDAGGIQASLHELSLVGALRLLPREHHPGIQILGVEPASLDFGMELTGPVAAALPRLVETARRLAVEGTI